MNHDDNDDDNGGGIALVVLHAIESIFGKDSDAWNLRLVGVACAVAFGLLRWRLYDPNSDAGHGIDRHTGINYFSLVHAILSGYGSAICVWLSMSFPGVEEPLDSILCNRSPVSVLHRIVPAVTMGYGIFDVLDGLVLSWDFILHGLATFFIMGYFCEYNVGEVVVPMLLMEISTIHLAMIRATKFPPWATAANMAMFAITFFAMRIVYVPLLWFRIVNALQWVQTKSTSSSLRPLPHWFWPVPTSNNTSFSSSQATEFDLDCLPWHFTFVVFSFGMFFNILNTFWFYKIVRKIIRKTKGRERLNDGNTLKRE